ncbi:uncharacterized protein LOC116130204 [Pistacia vera]|uniref:uncharacterized protein LOC116130204 n=1 Tax=Pistacia vera TaxID=55513 RepID=UPI001262DFE1|nr:uncharacterized protein LOC116130204 [Pistacia vera]
MTYFKPSTDATRVTTIFPPISIAIEGREHWADCLVGSFIDNKPPFHIVQSYAMKMWRKYGIIEVMMNNKAFFFFKFENESDMIQCLEDGPWLFQNRPILLQKWCPATELSKEAPQVISLWVKLFNVPLEFWNNVSLSYITNGVCKPLGMDKVTEDTCRLGSRCIGYARILVEVEATHKLPEMLNVCTLCEETGLTKMMSVCVHYQWRPSQCDQCSIFSHKDANCLQQPRHEGRVESGDLHKVKFVDNERIQLVTRKGKGTSQKGDILGVNGSKKSREEIAPCKAKLAKEQKVKSTISVSNVFQCLATTLEMRLDEPPSHPKNTGSSAIVEDKEMVMEEESELGNSDIELDNPSMVEFIKEGDLIQPLKQAEVRNFVKDRCISLCALLETRVTCNNCLRIFDNTFRIWNWDCNADQGNQGCMIVIRWDPAFYSVEVQEKTDQVMHCLIRGLTSDNSFFCSVIYVAKYHINRRELWRNLENFKEKVLNDPWLLMGDFNVTLNISESLGGVSYFTTSMKEFRECVGNLEVDDINRDEILYTWSGKPHGVNGVMKKLDRVMGNSLFMATFLRANTFFFPQGISDHNLVVTVFPQLMSSKP